MNQKGIIGSVILVFLLIIGIGAGVFLSQKPLILKPKATENLPAAQNKPIKSITINTTQFDTPIPPDSYQSGWEKPEIVPFIKTKVDQARKIGFNTVSLAFPWQRKIPDTSLLNEPALNNLKSILDYAKTNNMKVILPLNYCSAGWCWGAPGSSYVLSTDPVLWQKYQDYTKALVTSLSDYPNVNYLLFSENTVPQKAVLRNPEYPFYQSGFRNFWQTQNGNLSFLNGRWGTNFGSWDEVLPPPNNLEGANQSYIQDYYQWSANIVKNTQGNLASELKTLKNPESQIGYHDYLWNFQEILGSETGIPTPNPYDFLSIGMYPDWNNVQNYLNEPARYMNELDFYKNKFPASPIFIGELGADSITYPPENGQYIKQSFYITEILKQAKGKISGFNVWQLIDYNDTRNQNEGNFGLIKLDGTYKEPTVSTLRAHSLTPLINSSGVTTSLNPWAIWITGENLSSDLIFIVRDKNQIWLDYQTIDFNNRENYGSLTLPQNNPPSNCNSNSSCTLQLTLWDPKANLTSNTVNITIPAFSPSTSPSISPSPSPARKVGDIDNNGRVDIFDFNFLVEDYRDSNMRSDLNEDYKVDLFDFNLLITNFGW